MKARTVLYTASWQARPERARGPLRRGGEGLPRGGTVWQGLHGAKGQGGHQVCREPPWPHLCHRVAREGGRGHGRSFRHAYPRVELHWRRRWCRGSFTGDRWPRWQAGQRWATARPAGDVGGQPSARQEARDNSSSAGKPPATLRGTMKNASTGQMRSSNRPPACGAVAPDRADSHQPPDVFQPARRPRFVW